GATEVDHQPIVMDVAMLGEMRHGQVLADEELRGGGLVLVETKPRADRLPHARATGRMIVGPPLSDVVEEHAHHEELWLRKLPDDLRQMREHVLELAVAKPLDLPQREQRVMVDGIDVKRVMADQALEMREFGHE